MQATVNRGTENTGSSGSNNTIGRAKSRFEYSSGILQFQVLIQALRSNKCI